MPLPVPRPDETHDDFITRCMNDVDNTNEFPDREQRLAVCKSQAENADRKSIGIKYIRRAMTKDVQWKQFRDIIRPRSS